MDDSFSDTVRESGLDANMTSIGCYHNSLNFRFNYNTSFKRNTNKPVCLIILIMRGPTLLTPRAPTFRILTSGTAFGKLLITILFNCYQIIK